MARLIKKEDTEKIVKAIVEAETETSGEIKVHIQKKVKGDIFEAAKNKFDQLGMSETEDKNGVLIFIAVKDRKFTIIGDEGIDKKIPDNFWQKTVDRMRPFFADNNMPAAIETGVLSVGEQLKEFFPYQEDDVNELSDEVSIGE